MILDRLPAVQDLSANEKMLLIDELWDDLAARSDAMPATPEQIAELDHRMAAYRRDPSQVTTWEAIRGRLLPPEAPGR